MVANSIIATQIDNIFAPIFVRLQSITSTFDLRFDCATRKYKIVYRRVRRRGRKMVDINSPINYNVLFRADIWKCVSSEMGRHFFPAVGIQTPNFLCHFPSVTWIKATTKISFILLFFLICFEKYNCIRTVSDLRAWNVPSQNGFFRVIYNQVRFEE